MYFPKIFQSSTNTDVNTNDNFDTNTKNNSGANANTYGNVSVNPNTNIIYHVNSDTHIFKLDLMATSNYSSQKASLRSEKRMKTNFSCDRQ